MSDLSPLLADSVELARIAKTFKCDKHETDPMSFHDALRAAWERGRWYERHSAETRGALWALGYLRAKLDDDEKFSDLFNSDASIHDAERICREMRARYGEGGMP